MASSREEGELGDEVAVGVRFRQHPEHVGSLVFAFVRRRQRPDRHKGFRESRGGVTSQRVFWIREGRSRADGRDPRRSTCE